MTHWRTCEAGLLWQQISTPWQRANPWEAHYQRDHGAAHQGDDGGTGAGKRDDVEVVGQVELRMKREKLARGKGREDETEMGKSRSASSHLAGVTDLSQCGSASLSRCGVPGNDTCGIREMKHHKAAAFVLWDKKLFPPPRLYDWRHYDLGSDKD